jgi:hypothetical protein
VVVEVREDYIVQGSGTGNEEADNNDEKGGIMVADVEVDHEGQIIVRVIAKVIIVQVSMLVQHPIGKWALTSRK